jgi:hypothetical protein
MLMMLTQMVFWACKMVIRNSVQFLCILLVVNSCV